MELKKTGLHSVFSQMNVARFFLFELHKLIIQYVCYYSQSIEEESEVWEIMN